MPVPADSDLQQVLQQAQEPVRVQGLLPVLARLEQVQALEPLERAQALQQVPEPGQVLQVQGWEPVQALEQVQGLVRVEVVAGSWFSSLLPCGLAFVP